MPFSGGSPDQTTYQTGLKPVNSLVKPTGTRIVHPSYGMSV